jgi:hypothetical protein
MLSSAINISIIWRNLSSDALFISKRDTTIAKLKYVEESGGGNREKHC